MMERLRVLSLQPFYGGSHRAFMDGWIERSRHEWTLLSRPDRNWKWRMRHAAVHFQQEIGESNLDPREFDVVFCTDMMNLAEFKGLATPGWAAIPTVVYFHENQFAYPDQQSQSRDLHFAFTNLISMLAADQVWFNSRFNQQSFLQEYERTSKHWPDSGNARIAEQILAKSRVQPPGINETHLEETHPAAESAGGPLHLVWAARWEHDKGPDELYETLCHLQQRIEFRLTVLGQSYSRIPEAFARIKRRFANQIVGWGFQPSREEYLQAVAAADVFLSTARHEFFGLAVAEAIELGVFPLLPNRLSYPELLDLQQFPQNQVHLYGASPLELSERLVELDSMTDRPQIDPNFRRRFIGKYGWKVRAPELDRALCQVAGQTATLN